jgi:hypothetical protein
VSNKENESSVSMSPAARLALEETIEEFRADLETRILLAASAQGTTTRPATARDVAEAFNQLMQGATDGSDQERFRKIYRTFLSVLTGTYFVVGAIIFITLLVRDSLTFRDYSLTFSGLLMGTVVTVTFLDLEAPILRLIRRVSRPKPSSITGTRAGLIIRWMEIEETMRERLSEEIGESRVPKDIKNLISRFSSAANLSPADQDDLSLALRARNQAAHHRDVTQEDIDKAAEASLRLLKKIKNINLSAD